MKTRGKAFEFLVVEDNSGDFLLISEFLEDEFVNPVIHRADTYKKSLEFLHNEKHFDAALLDLTLPDKEGVELISEFMKHSGSLPVIVLTGYANKDFAIKSLSIGVSDYLLKDDLSSTALFKSILYSIERKKIDKKIRESEEKFRKLFEQSPVPKLVFDEKTLRILNVNQAAINNYGYTRYEFLSMYVDNLVVENELDKFLQSIKMDVESLDTTERTCKHKKKNGEVIIVKAKSNPTEFDGRDARIVIVEDITEKLKSEEQLQQSEKRFKALVQNGSDIISIIDKDANFLYVSPTIEQVLSVQPGRLIGKNAFVYIHEDDLGRVLKEFDKLKNKKEIHLEPFRSLDKDGQYRWMETTMTNMVDEPSVGGIVVNSRDITDRVEYLENLRYLSDLNQKIITSSDDMFYVFKVQDDKKLNQLIFISPQVEKLYGVSQEEFMNNSQMWRDLIHPDDLDVVIVQTNKLYSTKKAVTRTYRIKNKKTGKYLWIEDYSNPVLNEVGELIEVYGSAKDINERKMTEVLITRASIESEERERGRLSREMHDGVGQSLAAMNMYMNVLGSQLGKSKDEHLPIFKSIRELLLKTIDETRKVSHDLMPSEMKEFELYDCVSTMFERLNKVDPKIKYNIKIKGKEVPLEPIMKINLYRVIQEFIKNSQKYSEADKVLLIMSFTGKEIGLEISDNGKGFDMNQKKKSGIGVLNMIHRINSLGGKYDFITSPGHGVTLKIKVEFA
jgi:PAS domain S-box-containing protein